jgi:hypothetical protein
MLISKKKLRKLTWTTIDMEWGWSASICNNENEPVLVPTSTENTATGNSSDVIYEPFLSKVTLNGLRVTILSTIDIVEFLLKENYKYVLTGKLNQDCIEVRIHIHLLVYRNN